METTVTANPSYLGSLIRAFIDSYKFDFSRSLIYYMPFGRSFFFLASHIQSVQVKHTVIICGSRTFIYLSP